MKQNNYYISRKQKLLTDFNKASALIRNSIVSRYGEKFADMLIKEVRNEFITLIPKIPFTGISLTLRLFLIISTQELSVYKVMKNHGKNVAESWEICHEALRLRMHSFSKFKKWLAKRLLFSPIIIWIAKKRIQRVAKSKIPGDFSFQFVEGDGENFEWGVDYTECAIYNFMRHQDAEEFAPYVCMSDIALSDAMEWGLVRTETIADGCKKCDFRFKKGGITQISSKTPEVQTTIERIALKEKLC